MNFKSLRDIANVKFAIAIEKSSLKYKRRKGKYSIRKQKNYTKKPEEKPSGNYGGKSLLHLSFNYCLIILCVDTPFSLDIILT